MRIDIWSDLVCPWCYIGKRRFEQALAASPHRDGVEVVHHAFQLDPTLPRGQVFDQREMLARKYGWTPEQAEAMNARMEETAAGEGLAFHRANGMTGNTLDAHRLVQLARARGIQDRVIERFYRAHFTDQRSIFEHHSLEALAVDAGLDRDEVRRVLDSDEYADAVAADIEHARALGVSGVPFFVIADRFGVSGAQPAAVFTDALARAAAD